MTWQNDAAALWGEGWKAPLSECWGINRRTVERWSAGNGEPPEALALALAQVRRRYASNPRIAGALLRRMAAGETADQIQAELSEMRRALVKMRDDRAARLLRGGEG